jgi:magnesium-transporting ATPase (P-type)
MARLAVRGANRVAPPVNCPSWACCLLPCLLRTPSMVAYHAALPRDASVRRLQGANGATRTLRMDAASLVYGDVVEVKAGEVVGADLRVIECSADCMVDQTTLVGDDGGEDEDVLEAGYREAQRGLKPVTVTVTDRASPLVSSNVLLMATRLVKGSAVGVVIATGDETVWGQLLADQDHPFRRWPWATSSTDYSARRDGI